MASELVSVSTLLEGARDLVAEAADQKSIRIIIVGVADEVLVTREQVVIVLGALLREAIAAAPTGGRVAVTGQEMERELVFAVYESGGAHPRSGHFEQFASRAARAVGGRVWASRQSVGHLTLFSVPHCRDVN